MIKPYEPLQMQLTKYLFFTGKGGVGKTSIACATAISLADQGKNVLLISTDPASNLQDVFGVELDSKGVTIAEVPHLVVANLDPEEAAKQYRDQVIGPYVGKLPDAIIKNMEEQLSGSCTVEIAAFNEFSNFITDIEIEKTYDHILFDTAPTGHTLRMLQLPSAWSSFISESTHGASCLGQLSGLENKKEIYKNAVNTLIDKSLTTLVLVARPESAPLKEANRASLELKDIGVNNQILIFNGVLSNFVEGDTLSTNLYAKQQDIFGLIPKELEPLEMFQVPLRSYNVTGITQIRKMLHSDEFELNHMNSENDSYFFLRDLIDDMYKMKKKVIFTMGKGGVGKTTLASAIALGLVQKGVKVHLTTTDPAHHIHHVIEEGAGLTISRIDEKLELEKYKQDVMREARSTMGASDLAYIEEDLKSPCTQEIAVFRAFAEIVDKADKEVVVIDTAPTGHTLLLLDSTQSYHKEVGRTGGGNIPKSVRNLLPRLRDESETEVVIITLPEATPVHEATRLSVDLKRAGMHNKWWIVNSSISATKTNDPLLLAKAQGESIWINKVSTLSNGNFVVVPLKDEEIIGNKLLELL